MKKQLLFLATAILGFTSANAQCTITASCTPDATSGYCTTPSIGSNLPNAMVNSAYSTVIQISVGATAMNGTVSVDGASITGATLPSGLNYTVNPALGMAGGTSGCVEITGTPTSTVSNFNVVFDVSYVVNGGTVSATTFSYALNVVPSTASLTEANSTELTLFPNPAEDKLTVTVNTPTTIKIVNVLGTVVMEESITSSKTMNVSELKNGIYFVTNTSTGRSTKFIKK